MALHQLTPGEVHFGGARYILSSGFSGQIRAKYRVWRIKFTGGGTPEAKLPNATDLPLGFYFVIFGDTGTTNFSVKDYGGNTIRAMSATSKCVFMLMDNSDEDGTWTVEVTA